MSVSLAEKSIAILAAGGFEENQMTALQRALTKAKAPFKVVAPEQGLVNGWQDGAWGHYFTVDAPIGTALGSDFDALVLLGGKQAVEKLKTNLHTRRIVNHFLEAGKPIAALGEGVALLALSPKSAGRTVAAIDSLVPVLEAAQMDVSDEPEVTDGVLLTGNGTDLESFVETAMDLFSVTSPFADEQVAA